MKTLITIVTVLFSSLFVNAQVIDWSNFNERHMDTVMFNEMNNYRNQEFGDSLVWSNVVQDGVMIHAYNFIKDRTHMDITLLHSKKWSFGLPDTIKNNIIEENANPYYLNSTKYEYVINSEKGIKGTEYGIFRYGEIIVSIPTTTCNTYKKMAIHAIDSWDTSTHHRGHMNAHYKNKVIVGTITYFCKETQRVFISFVYVS